jgi:elongation factor Ts
MNIDLIKKLREETGLSVAECKKALEEAGGDEGKAREILKEKSAAVAEKKSQAEVKEGLIWAYVHNNGKIGVLLELGCQTDFVARNEEFRSLANDLAMHIAAMNPASEEELLVQPFIKDPSKTIDAVLKEKIAKIGENIRVNKFIRFSI